MNEVLLLEWFCYSSLPQPPLSLLKMVQSMTLPGFQTARCRLPYPQNKLCGCRRRRGHPCQWASVKACSETFAKGHDVCGRGRWAPGPQSVQSGGVSCRGARGLHAAPWRAQCQGQGSKLCNSLMLNRAFLGTSMRGLRKAKHDDEEAAGWTDSERLSKFKIVDL